MEKKSLKVIREGRKITYHGIAIRLISASQQQQMKPEDSGIIFSKA